MAWNTSEEVTKGSTDVSLYFVITAGLTITDLDLQYTRSGSAAATKVDLTALSSSSTAHEDNKAIYVDGTNSPGLLRVDVPDAAFASGINEVLVCINHSTAAWIKSIKLLNYDSGSSDVVAISGDSTAADNFETMLDGTGGKKLTLSQLKIVATGSDSAIDVLGSGTGHGIKAQGGTDSTIGGDGFNAMGGDSATQGGSGIGAVAGSGNGIGYYGRGTGNGAGFFGFGGSGAGAAGARFKGGDTSGAGMSLEGGIGGGQGLDTTGVGSGSGIRSTGGLTNGFGFYTLGKGTGAGNLNQGGTTGEGQINSGGTTSGSGQQNIAVSGSGQDNITSNGHGQSNGGTTGGQYNGSVVGYGQKNEGATIGRLNVGVDYGSYQSASAGIGEKNEGTTFGQINNGNGTNAIGQRNSGTGIGYGQENISSQGYGQYNTGKLTGQLNTASDGTGQLNQGTSIGQKNKSNNGNGQINEGGTNGIGQQNLGAGTGLDFSAESNDLGITTSPTVVAIRTEMDANSTKLADILLDTAAIDLRLPSDPADESLIEAAIAAIPAGATAVQVRTEMDANSTKLISINDKTTNLPSDPADESLLEAAIATRSSQSSVDTVYSTLTPKAAESSIAALAIVANAIQAKTDSLTFSGTSVQADVKKIEGSATVDGLTITNWFESLLSHARGKIVRIGNLFSYKKQDGSTTTFTFTSSDSGRTP